MSAERTDGRRNREIVLHTAMRVFAEEGLAVPLSRIAQRASVGAGTVYRHFPSKEFLIEAVLAEHLHALVRAADGWAARAAPGDALLGFLFEAIEQTPGRVGACDALTADKSWPRATLAAAVERFRAAAAGLLLAAKRAGAVRPDLQPDDLTALLAAGAALRAAHRSRARGARLVRMLLAGLLTKDPEFGDSVPARRHETGHCLECGARLQVRPTGRPPSYCGPTCRQRARRKRR